MSETPQEWMDKFSAAEAPEIALACLDRALDLDPEFVPALGCKGTLLGQVDRHEEALDCFQRIVQLDPGSGAAHYSIGLHLQTLGRPEEAIAAYTQAIEVSPQDPDPLVNRGHLLDERGLPEQAIADYDRALALNAKEEIAWSNRGNSLMALERFEDAIESFEHALKLDPKSLSAQLGLSSALMSLGRLDEADAKRPQGTSYDRGPVREIRHDLPSGRDLVLRYYPQKHSNPALLAEVAEDLLQYCAGLETEPPGLSDGIRIGFMWSVLTLRDQGDKLVLCEPAFDRFPLSQLSYDTTFTLQTNAMLRLLHSVTGLPPCDCTCLDTIAIQRGAIAQDELELVRLHPTDDDRFSGWVVGPSSQAEAEALLESELFDRGPTAALVRARPHLIKCLSLPPGCVVRFDKHKVTSVLGPEGDELWVE